MKDRRSLLVGVAIVALYAVATAGPPAQPKAKAAPESLDVRVARARLQLAEANLKRVEETNRKVARAVTGNTVAEFRADVAVAKARLDLAIAGGQKNDFQGWLRDAEAAAKSAETQWQSALEANRRTPRTVNPLDVERLRLRFELARAQVERGRALADKSAVEQTEWRVDLLADEVQRLKEEVARPAAATRVYPLYPAWPY
jgi:hypothetical protein